MPTMRTLVRLAQRIHDAWQQRSKLHSNHDYPWRYATEAWNELQALRRRLHMAEVRGFVHCLASLREDFRWKFDELSRKLLPLKDFHGQSDQKPDVGDWVRELRALEDEFNEINIDDRLCTLRVTTESITLQGVELGSFAIDFVWSRLPQQRGSSCFDIVALEPNPATGRDEVNHPHVNDLELCAGDAGPSIERALNDGRISDAFVLIRSVLLTYNPKSAYVQLSEWDGLSCGDCGGRVQRDQSSYCSGCENDLCDHCASSCRSCEETRCCGCLNTCDGCRDLCCSRCLEEIESGQSLCSSCRGVCGECSTVMFSSDLNDASLCTECASAAETQVSETPPIPSPSFEVTHAS